MTGDANAYYVGPDNEPDKYRLLRQVGAGGEAELWQADLSVASTTLPVAVKILRTDRMDEFDKASSRWAEQAELLRFVRHPAVVAVREHFEGKPMHLADYANETPGRSLYLVMNWIDGVPLRDWVASNYDSPDRLRQTVLHLEQVASVLDWLHSGDATTSRTPFIHGDLSPGNVMITPIGQAVLVDFGLMRVAAHQTRQAAGTPGYAAPEVWTEGRYSPESDLYSFGALAYFALTGANPPVEQVDIAAGLSTVPSVARAGSDALGELMKIYSKNPIDRPRASEWIRGLKFATTTSKRPIAAETTQLPPTNVAQQTPSRPGTPPGSHLKIGLVIAAAALVVLIFGVALTSNQAPTGGGATPTIQSTTTVAAASTGQTAPADPTSQASTGESSTQGQSPADQPTWTGEVRVSNEDFSHDTPQLVDGVFYHGSVSYDPSNNTLEFHYDAVALWNEQRDPSFDECVALSQTQALTQDEYQHLPYRSGQGVCYVWESGAVFLRGDGPPSGDAVEMRGIKWPIH